MDIFDHVSWEKLSHYCWLLHARRNIFIRHHQNVHFILSYLVLTIPVLSFQLTHNLFLFALPLTIHSIRSYSHYPSLFTESILVHAMKPYPYKTISSLNHTANTYPLLLQKSNPIHTITPYHHNAFLSIHSHRIHDTIILYHGYGHNEGKIIPTHDCAWKNERKTDHKSISK